MSKNSDIKKLKEKLRELGHFSTVFCSLEWDKQVNLPPKASIGRAQTMAYLAGLAHEKFLALNNDGLLSRLKKELKNNKLNSLDATVVRETSRLYERERKLPTTFVRELEETTSQAYAVWMKAREQSNFAMFLPWLKKIVALKRKQAKFFGYRHSPYDALLDIYEPGMTTKEITKIFEELKQFLVPFLKKIKNQKNVPPRKLFKGLFPLEKQKVFNALIAKTMHFDFEAGRLDASTHPFTIGLHTHDVRITTRYREKDVLYSIFSTIHEAGHGLYEQGLLAEHFATPLGESISLGIHESQSRLWENMVGRSQAFWNYFLPKLQKFFPKPFANVSLEELYRAVNYVDQSLIRTEADEVTYNLHIILRFEIEKELIEGRLQAEDIPKVWKKKMKSYFDITVPNDRLGVLQDVHWSGGSFGYFPTYTLGNLYAAQIYATAQKELPNLEKNISQGRLQSLREWLRKKIHIHGKQYTAEGLIKQITGELPTSKYFIEYLQNKFGKLYNL